MNKNSKQPKDSKGKLHGYQEWYGYGTVLYFRGMCKHGKWIGYQETQKQRTNYHIR